MKKDQIFRADYRNHSSKIADYDHNREYENDLGSLFQIIRIEQMKKCYLYLLIVQKDICKTHPFYLEQVLRCFLLECIFILKIEIQLLFQEETQNLFGRYYLGLARFFKCLIFFYANLAEVFLQQFLLSLFYHSRYLIWLDNLL